MKWVLCMTAVALVGLDGRADDKDDLKALQGKWKLVSGERGGNEIPAGELPAGTISIEKDGKLSTALAGYEMEGTFKLDGAKDPKRMEIAHTKGPDADKKQFVIYKVEKDKLTVCAAAPGKSEDDRPTAFTTKDSENVLFVFERVK